MICKHNVLSLKQLKIQTELDVLVLFGGRQKDLKLFCGKRLLNSALLSILMLALLIMLLIWSVLTNLKIF